MATAVEEIFSAHCGRPVRAGDYVVADVDVVMAQDGNGPLAIDLLRNELGGSRVFDTERVVLVIDHCAPAPSQGAAEMQRVMREFAEESGVRLFDVGEGISHVILPEHGYAQPGRIIVGSDSHTATCGVLNCIGIGLGATDIAVAIRYGRCWFRVPHTITVQLSGTLRNDASAKDVALAVVRAVGLDGATGACLQFEGSGLYHIDIAGRFTLCNMSIEVGAKTSFMGFDDITQAYLHPRSGEVTVGVCGDTSSALASVDIQLDDIGPLISLPHEVDNIVEAQAAATIAVDVAFIGTCTNGRLSDLRAAAAVLRGRSVHPHVRLIVTPGSRAVYLAALREGLLEDFLMAGALVNPPGCGPCIGVHQGVPGNGEVVISTGSRNFRGRMGNVNASIVLGSPETVAASAIAGHITPRRDL